MSFGEDSGSRGRVAMAVFAFYSPIVVFDGAAVKFGGWSWG